MYFEQCSRCSAFLGSGTIPATGHQFDENGVCIHCGVVGTLILLGDSNADGSLNSRDILLMRKYLAEMITDEDVYLLAMDMDSDEDITVSDVVLLRKTLSKNIPEVTAYR